MLGGKFYYVVKVPSWQKHGVCIWPEVLQEVSIDESSIDLRQPPDLTGWLCEYVLGDNGNPKKAIALTNPQL